MRAQTTKCSNHAKLPSTAESLTPFDLAIRNSLNQAGLASAIRFDSAIQQSARHLINTVRSIHPIRSITLFLFTMALAQRFLSPPPPPHHHHQKHEASRYVFYGPSSKCHRQGCACRQSLCFKSAYSKPKFLYEDNVVVLFRLCGTCKCQGRAS